MKALFNDARIRALSDKELINKTKKKSPTTKRGGSLFTQISQINADVMKYLGQFKEEYELITEDNVSELEDSIQACIDYGYCAIDTETTGLDPIVDKCVGVSLFAPNIHALYVPVNHISYTTGMRAKHQISSDVLASLLKRLADAGTKIIMFNAVFDIRVIRNQLGVNLECYWDCSLASRCMNENEPEKSLKKLYKKYILKGKEDAFKFDELFNNIGFDKVPIKTGYLYAAHDAKVTFELYEYQKQYLYYEPECVPEARNGMNGVSWVFFNIEMPCVSVVADLEDTGVALDLDYAEELKVKYTKKLENTKAEAHKLISMYDTELSAYNGKTKLSYPLNIDSPSQVAVLLYDIMGEKPVDKDKPRGTGEDILEKIGSPVCKAILEYRGIKKLMSTYIEKLPKCVHKDGRVHCKFNQYGADTGRFSSKDPNLQNIPSHNKDIRKMFVASPGCVLMSSDFSQQEIKGMAQMCGDEMMIEAFRQGKDFYAQIASVAFNYPYEDCLEFRPDGTTNPEGKERRSQAKSILLGINYGRGAQSIAEQLGCTKKKAEKIKEDVFKGFPAIEKFEADSKAMAENLGYVTTLWGRKRRLPIMTHPDYEFEWKEGAGLSDDPLDFDSAEDIEDEVPYPVIRKWMKKLSKVWKQQDKNYIIAQADIEGIKITDNTKARTDAVRQIVNSRIQGTAADQSKLAMIKIANDERLKELGFRMLIPVHDEIIAECPKEYARECRDRFKMLMETSGGEAFTIPISCDVSVTERWYGEELDL